MLARLSHPYLLLSLCVLFWAGNFVIGRAVVGVLPPLAMSFWRWLFAALILLPWVIRPLLRDWPLLRAKLGKMLLLALLSVTGFNTLLYIGLQDTTAVNALLMQSSLPLVIIALNWLLFRGRSGWVEGAAVVLSLSGVLLILARGDWQTLLQGQANSGDLWVVLAVLTWALYSVLLRWRPQGLDPLAFLGFIVLAGLLMLLPLWLWELSQGIHMQLVPQSVMAIAYVAVFPSVLSYLFWNRGVAEVGANRAGHFIHLGPVFGTLLAIVLLGEVFAWYHAVGGLLVALGIGLTVVFARR